MQQQQSIAKPFAISGARLKDGNAFDRDETARFPRRLFLHRDAV